MTIKKISLHDELSPISELCLRAFTQAVAPNESAEGIATFHNVACVHGLQQRLALDCAMFIYEYQYQPIGMIAMMEGRHIAMLFIDPKFQRRGVGRSLLYQALSCARHTQITVNSSLVSIPAYQNYGFALVGESKLDKGLRFQPMMLDLSTLLQRFTAAETAS